MGIALLVVGVVLVWLAITWNGLVKLRALAANAWADIDVQLKRRHDLVPQLVSAVKGAAGFERGTLERVVEARNRAVQAEQQGPRAAGAAEQELAAGLRQLFALAEAYPDLKAGASYLELQRSLVQVEDTLQNARRYYNAVVRDLNTKVAQFPTNLVAGPMGFRPAEFFGLASAAEGAVPVVDVEVK